MVACRWLATFIPNIKWSSLLFHSYLNYINDSFSEHRAISFHQILLSGSPSVAENQPRGTKIGSFTSVDSNSNDRHTYSIVSGGAGKFELQGANLITLITFNYETSPNTWVTTESGKIFSFLKTFPPTCWNKVLQSLSFSDRPWNIAPHFQPTTC